MINYCILFWNIVSRFDIGKEYFFFFKYTRLKHYIRPRDSIGICYLTHARKLHCRASLFPSDNLLVGGRAYLMACLLYLLRSIKYSSYSMIFFLILQYYHCISLYSTSLIWINQYVLAGIAFTVISVNIVKKQTWKIGYRE